MPTCAQDMRGWTLCFDGSAARDVLGPDNGRATYLTLARRLGGLGVMEAAG